MSKFKKGDRVRVLTSDWPEYIPVGTVTNVYGTDVGGVDLWSEKLGDPLFFLDREIELVDEPKFKVGDRVRVVKDGRGPEGSHHGARIGDEFDIASVDELFGVTEYHTNGWFFHAHEIELIPATITIQAGRYYKTRDGRKVGPMGKSVFADAFYDKARRITSQSWYSDGAFFKGATSKFDLIAEWIDEPAARTVAVAATAGNDNAAPAKFKVGDRVLNREVPEAGVGIVEIVKPEGGYTVNYKDAWYGRCHDDDKHLVAVPTPTNPAIVCLLEDGQPRPSTTPHVHSNRASAEKEAGRLAGKHPGKEFGVYELVHRHREEPVYKHEWQRLAVDPKVRPWLRDDIAAEALMKQSGVDHDTAIRAVKQFRKAA